MNNTASTRRVMAGAFAGALLVLALSTALGWHVGPEVAGETDGPTNAVRDAPPGTCLTWTRPDAGDARRVKCDDPHLFEITGSVDLAADFPPGAPFPDSVRWEGIAADRCTEMSVQYLDGRFDPNGKLGVNLLRSGEKSWNSGERKVWCGMQDSAPSGLLYPTVGSAKTADPSNVHPQGMCLGISGKQVYDPVECGKPHAYEVVGVVNLGARFPQEFPAEPRQDELLAGECARTAADYAGGAEVVSRKGLIVFWDTLKQDSWLAGARRVECKVGAKLKDNSGLAPVFGSVKSEMRVGTEAAPVLLSKLPPGAPAPPGSPGTDVQRDAGVPTDANSEHPGGTPGPTTTTSGG
ncbi:septum formation family protein [Crossiella sp. CA198]|uniref:septum formation family protein n=1 Tax=Crossiella sp. CA198 TaxID=3455607 RepID=UPI003F8D89F2